MTKYVPPGYIAAFSSTECTSSLHVALHDAPRHGAVITSHIHGAFI